MENSWKKGENKKEGKKQIDIKGEEKKQIQKGEKSKKKTGIKERRNLNEI